jgi:hypothetical protein
MRKSDPKVPAKYVRQLDRAIKLARKSADTVFYGEGAEKARKRLDDQAARARRRVLETIHGLMFDER